MRFYIRNTDSDSVKIYFDIGISRKVKLRGVTNQIMNPVWNDWARDRDGQFKISKKTGKKFRSETVDIDLIKKNAPDGEKKRAQIVRNSLEEFESVIKHKLGEIRRNYSDDLSIRDALQEEVNEYYNEGENESKKMTFLRFIDQQIRLKKKKKILKNRRIKKLSKGHIQHMERTRDRIAEFIKTEKASHHYNRIDEAWHQSFMDFLEEKYEIQNNTLAGYTKILKGFLGAAYDEGQHNNRKYRKFEEYSEIKIRDYHSTDELREIESRIYSGVDGVCMQYYLLMSYTGMRISEIMPLTSDNIITHKGIPMIEFIDFKNDRERHFLITEDVQRILNRYGGTFGNVHRDKKIGPWTIRRFLRKEFTNKTIRPHTGRRNYCTNEYLKPNTLVEDIRRQSGHRSEEIFHRYIQASGREILRERRLK